MKVRLLCLIFGAALAARADSQLSFEFMPADDSFGGIWWNADDRSAGGQDVYVLSVYGHVDTIFDRACLSCVFNMDLGTLQSSDPSTWMFTPGGTFTIFGGVDGVPDVPEYSPDDSQPVLAAGTFIGTPTVSLVSYDPLFDISTLKFDAQLSGNILPQLSDYFGFDSSGLGSLFMTFTVLGSVMGGDSFQADTLLSGNLTFNGLPATPEPSPVLLLGLVAPLLYWVARRRHRTKSA